MFAVSLAYNDSSVIDASLAQFYKTTSAVTKHYVLDQHWPLGSCREVLKKYPVEVLDAGKNIGLAAGFNYCLERVTGDGVVIGFDLDCYPITPGWDKAMQDVMVDKVAWVSLWQGHAHNELLVQGRMKREYRIAGHRVIEAGSPCLNSVCGFRIDWLKSVGGLSEPRVYYGGLENHMWKSLQPNKWVFLRDYCEGSELCGMINPLYREYKWSYAHLGTTDKEFGEWLKTR